MTWLNSSHDMTKPIKWVCAQRRLRSASASNQSDQSLMCAQWVAKDPRFLHSDSEDSDQTGRMPRLIWVFAGCTLTLLVLSYEVTQFEYASLYLQITSGSFSQSFCKSLLPSLFFNLLRIFLFLLQLQWYEPSHENTCLCKFVTR